MTFERRVLFYHHLFESLKHGYAVREMLDDEKFVNLAPVWFYLFEVLDIQKIYNFLYFKSCTIKS